jgi:Transposase domain (DUF772)
MLATESRQVGFFDAAELVRPLPQGSFYALLAEHGERIVSDQDFAECYSERRRGPSIPPSKLAKVLLLQHRTGLSDEQAMEAVCWDLRWKVALGLAVDDEGWHPTTMTKFRARLLLHGKERTALENTLRLAEELGLLAAPAEQIVDSTPMLGAAATQDTVRLVRSGVRKLLDAVRASDHEAGETLDASLEFDYAKPNDKPDCRWREKAERERMLSRVAQDAERALRAVEQVEVAHKLLRELIGQDFDVDSGGVPRLHRGTRAGRILSVHDVLGGSRGSTVARPRTGRAGSASAARQTAGGPARRRGSSPAARSRAASRGAPPARRARSCRRPGCAAPRACACPWSRRPGTLPA